METNISLFQVFNKTKSKESDYLPDRRVRTEENSYCEDDYRVLNEGKLLGCLTVVYSMKENFLSACGARTDEISSCWHDLRARCSDFFIQYTMWSCPH